MMVVGEEYPNDVRARGVRAMAKASHDETTAEIAVHAVVRLPGNIAGVAIGIDLHMHMTALSVFAALPRGKQCEVAPYDDPYGLLRITCELNDGALVGPDDFERGPILSLDRHE
ncbi:hypothetical protein LJR255_003140 [Pararhizobium sp. LjRoot255]